MNDTPDISVLPEEAPRAIIAAMGASEGIFSLDSVADLRTKLGEAKSGIGDVGDDGLFTFMAVDIASKGDGEPHFYPYEHSVHPGTVTGIREMTVGFWNTLEAQWRRDRRPETPPDAMVPPGFQVVEGGLQGLMEMLAGGGGPPGVPRRDPETTHEGLPAIRAEVEESDECCCGHTVSAHGDAEKFVGACMVEGCNCNLYHTHPEEKSGEKQGD